MFNFKIYMQSKIQSHFRNYKKLVQEINELTNRLEKIHGKYMQCKKGCDLCCMDFSIFPVEFYFILNEVRNKPFEVEERIDNSVCSFLKNHSCTIYSFRPIMCRTHGFPLVYSNEAGEPELSTCHLNFNQFDFEKFTIDNTIAQDKFNSKLFMLNKKFIQDFEKKKYGEFDLIPLKELLTTFIGNNIQQ